MEELKYVVDDSTIVRENQIAGYVDIDKQENRVLQDLANRQGLDENEYYQLFVKIIIIGIAEFERYRQSMPDSLIWSPRSGHIWRC